MCFDDFNNVPEKHEVTDDSFGSEDYEATSDCSESCATSSTYLSIPTIEDETDSISTTSDSSTYTLKKCKHDTPG